MQQHRTPDIGTTISDAWGGLGRMISAMLVPAIVVGLVIGAIVAVASGMQALVGGSFGTLLAALGNAAGNLLGIGLAVVAIGVAMERREAPSPGAAIGESLEAVMSLQPKVLILPALSLVGPVLGLVVGVLGALGSLAAGIASIFLGVRWIYAPAAGATGVTGDDAFEASEQFTEGNWWATLGTWIVIFLATAFPAGIAGTLIAGIFALVFGAVLGSVGFAVVFALVLFMILWAGIALLASTAYASAWQQLTGTHPGQQGGGDMPPPATPPQG